MNEIIAAFVGAIAAVVVWYLSARDLRKIDRENKKREIRLQFLVDAYRKIESSGNRPLSHDSEYARNIENAIGDIQLFGSRKQVELTQAEAKLLCATGHATHDALLNELRRDLRSELDLEALSDERQILRITEKK